MTNTTKDSLQGGTPTSDANVPQTPTPAVITQAGQIAVMEQKLAVMRNEILTLTHDSAAIAQSAEKESALIAQYEKALIPIVKREQDAVTLLRELNTKERGAPNPEERRAFEQGRWEQIEQWYNIEQQKWEIQEKLETQKKDVEEHRKARDVLFAREQALRSEIELIEREEEKLRLNDALDIVVRNRKEAERHLADFQARKQKATMQFTAVANAEEGVEKKETEVESLLASVHSLSEERKLVEERYRLERERHETELARWKIEDEIVQLGSSVTGTEQGLTKLKKEEAEIVAKLTALESGG